MNFAGFWLRAAAGMLFAAAGVELMPEALSAEPAWLILLAIMGSYRMCYTEK